VDGLDRAPPEQERITIDIAIRLMRRDCLANIGFFLLSWTNDLDSAALDYNIDDPQCALKWELLVLGACYMGKRRSVVVAGCPF
jgi:hypothetical protein